jgi:hypothetical protein
MAKSKKIPLSGKAKFKKPVKTAKKAIQEAERIRNNERAALKRAEYRFKVTRKKTEADRLRKEIKARNRALDAYKGELSGLRKLNASIASEKASIKSLKLKNAAIDRKLSKMYGKGQYTKEYLALNKQKIRNDNAITVGSEKINLVLYDINRKFGFSPERIGIDLKIKGRTLMRERSKDFDAENLDDYNEEMDAEYPGAGLGALPDVESEEDQEESEEELGGADFVTELTDIFWEVWKDFDRNELGRIDQYKQVIFIFNGRTHKFKGSSATLISMTASDMWSAARGKGSDAQISKEVSLDGESIRYTLD